ncbi:unnamed protein product [Camellia sinensis]
MHIRYDGMGWNGVPSNFAFPFPCLPLLQESENLDKARGKALMIVEEDVMEGKNHLEGYFSVVMLLSLLSQPLYLRSIAHLEQLLSLLDVIVDNAESKSSLFNESGIPAAEQTSGPHISTSVADINTVSSAISSGSDITASKPNDDSKPSASSTNAECDTQNVLDNLPQAELRLLCSLLAREGDDCLSDNAYTMAAEVLKKLVAIAPTHCRLLITELADSMQNLTKSAMDDMVTDALFKNKSRGRGRGRRRSKSRGHSRGRSQDRGKSREEQQQGNRQPKTEDGTTVVTISEDIALFSVEEEECLHMSDNDTEWVVDTAASYHAISQKEFFNEKYNSWSLMYAMVSTRPDIAHAVGVVSRFLSNLGKEHWEAVKWILRYLKGTAKMCLCFRDAKPVLEGYTDSDMAGDLDGRKSTSGFLFTFAGGAVSWQSKLQKCVALSTTEAEYIAAAEAGKEMLWLKRFLQELGLKQEKFTALALEPLWLELSACISKVESYSDSPHYLSNKSVISAYKPSGVMPPLPAGTQNILPYIESFFVICEKLQPGQSVVNQDLGNALVSNVEDAATSTSLQKTSGSALKADEKHLAFVKFSEKHQKLLNSFIRKNRGLLEKSFSLMLKVPRFIDFDNKRAHFRSKIKHQHDHHHSPLRISVRRAYILEDSYNQLRMRLAQDLKGRLNVYFQGEEGIDAGGLTREWYQLLSRVIFDKGALLFATVGNESTFQPNPNSIYQTEHLLYFKFVGRVVGKALFDGQLLDVHFTRSFYKHILGVKVTYHDIEAIDPDYFKNLKWMLENNTTDVLDPTFSIDADEEKRILYEKTEVTDYELIPGGRNIRVSEENKHEYVDLVAEHRLTTAIRPQITAFLEGFSELIPSDLISIFNDKELELLISGLPDIDLDDMRVNTEYSGYSAASPVIQWFWEVVQSFSKEDKARLLQFVTGTSKEGFSSLQGVSGSQKFQIHKAYGSPDHLPSAHTCFNQLDLPEYPSKQHLQERLLLAIHEANEGFGFG